MQTDCGFPSQRQCGNLSINVVKTPIMKIVIHFKLTIDKFRHLQ